MVVRRESPHIVVLRLGESAITLNIKIKALEESGDPKDAITAALNRFDLVIQAFDETTTKPVNKVVDNFVQPVIERC